METEHPAQSGWQPAGPDPDRSAAGEQGRVAWRRPDTPGPAPTQQWPLPATPATPPPGAVGGPAPSGPHGPWQATQSTVPSWHSADPTAPHAATAPPPAAPPGRRPGRVARWLTAGAAGLVLVAGAGVAGGVTAHSLDTHSTTTAVGTSAVPVKASNGTVTVAQLVAAVKPSVVTIAASSRGGTSEGSGVIVRSDGMVVTNYHVISGATGAIQVTLADGTTHDATVAASDASNDLALLKVSGVSGLTAASVGDSSQLQVGDDVIAIGNPLGLGISVSEGIVSALDRQVTVGDDSGQGRGSTGQVSYGGAIQTDAAVNEGNSGGALINTSGQLIGITSAIATSGTSTGNLGVAFAIPSSQVQTFLSKALS